MSQEEMEVGLQEAAGRPAENLRTLPTEPSGHAVPSQAPALDEAGGSAAVLPADNAVVTPRRATIRQRPSRPLSMLSSAFLGLHRLEDSWWDPHEPFPMAQGSWRPRGRRARRRRRAGAFQRRAHARAGMDQYFEVSRTQEPVAGPALHVEPLHVVRDNQEPLHVVRDNQEPLHVVRDNQEPLHVVRDNQEPLHVVRDNQEPLHVVRDNQEQSRGEAAERNNSDSSSSSSEEEEAVEAPAQETPPAATSAASSQTQAEPPQALSQASTEHGSHEDEEAEVQQKQETPPKEGEPSVHAAPPDEDEGDTCSICFELWTNIGQHRVSTLRCGHLFGYSCIKRWLRGQAGKCPQCNRRAKPSDIVMLYARTVKPLDICEQEQMKSSLEKEKVWRRQAELESAQSRLQLLALREECKRLRQEIQELRALMAQHRASTSQQACSCRQSRHKYYLEKVISVSQAGNCRVMTYCDSMDCLVVSQPSPQSTLIPGCGVKMLSLADMKSGQYIPIHSKQIRGLAFSTQGRGLLLSAALDGTLKLTSLASNTVVQTYDTGRPVWSCCWCLDDTNYVYAGLVNGSIMVYDLRDTNSHVQELVPQRSRCPMVSLSYLPRMASASLSCGGILAGTLEGACFWERKDANSYRPHHLPLEHGGCIDIQTEINTRHCLATYRPGKNNPYVRCVMMELTCSPLTEASEEVVSSNPVQTFSAGSTCKLLTKNAIFQSPEDDGNIFVCAGDEASNSALLWDAGSGSFLQKLPAYLPVLDICPLTVNQNHLLATLTEKVVNIYKWH